MDSVTQLAVQRLAAEIVRLKKEVDVLKRGIRTTQLEGAVIDNSTISFTDSTGAIVHTIGMQPDGTVASVTSSVNPPPQPSTPVVGAIPSGLIVGWDGASADGSIWPADFSAIQIHVSDVNGFVPNISTIVGTLVTAGNMTVSNLILGHTYYVSLVAVNTSNVVSAPSVEVSGVPVGAILAAGAVTQAALAAGLALAGNLSTNPYFAGGDITGWTVTNATLSTTYTPPGTSPTTGGYVAQLASTGTNGGIVQDSNGFSFPVLPNTQYLITAWVNMPSGTNNFSMGVDWRNGATYVSSAGPTLSGTGDWAQYQAVLTSPASGVNRACPRVTANASGVTFYVWGLLALPQVPGGLVQAGTITATQIAAQTITAALIASATITATQIAANTITASQIAASTITAAQIAANTITAAQIAAGSLTSAVIGNLGACLNQNPFFAAGSTAGWFVSGTGNTITPVSGASIPAGAPYGNGSTNWAVQFVATGGGTSNKFSNGNAPFGLQLSNRYVATAWVYSSTAQSVGIGFEWRNSGTLVSTSSATTAIAANTWTLISAAETAPASGVTTGNITIYAGTASTIYIQAAQAFPQIQGIVDATTITSSIINAGTFNGTDFVINSLGMFFYSGTPGLGNLVLSITPAAGANDGLGNAFKADFTVYDTGGGGQYIQVAAGNPPSVTVGDSVNTWKMDQSFTTSNTHTIGNTTGASNISDVMNIPANHAITGTHYIIEVPITGVFEGGVINIGMLVGVTYTNLVPTTASAFTTGHNFAGTIRFHLQVVLQGASGTANIWLEGTLSDASVNRSPTTTMSIDGIKTAIAFDTTIAQNFAMGWQWGSSITGQTVTGNNNTLTRRGA